MSEATFRRDIQNSISLADKIEAYTSEFEYSIKLACGELKNTKVVTLNCDTEDKQLRVIKARILGDYFNLAITNKRGITDKEIENETDNRIHFIIIIEDETFTIVDCLDTVMSPSSLSENDIKHLSKSHRLYKLSDTLIRKSMDNLFKEERVQRQFTVKTNYDNLGYEKNKLYHMDCMIGMENMGDECVDFVLTDIPYDAVNRYDSSKSRINSQALRILDKGNADTLNFDLDKFLEHIVRISSNSVCVFCGYQQIGQISDYFSKVGLTTRIIVWEKTQFSPMNGDIVYGSNVEFAVWGKKHNNGVFNAFCKGTVFRYSSGQSKIHPTQKNVDLFKELIADNTNEGMLVFDPCIGSGTTAVAALETNRNFIGFEKEEKWYNAATERIAQSRNIIY